MADGEAHRTELIGGPERREILIMDYAPAWPDMNAYAEAKSEVVERIIAAARAEREGGSMELLDFLIEFHRDAERQGPGSPQTTLRALRSVPHHDRVRTVLDIGCGTGAQTLELARATTAEITAVDIFPSFLNRLRERAEAAGLEDRIRPVRMSMDALAFPSASFDLIWAEGCIYHIGFENGLKQWKRYLKPGGHLVVSEISWLTDTRPSEIEAYWLAAYSEIDTIEGKRRIIDECGYELVDDFVLPPECWTDRYYEPIRARSSDFAKKHGNTPAVEAFIREGLHEAEMYDRYGKYYSYVFYVMGSD